MQGRVIASLAGLSTKVSQKLAESFEKHSISNFTLLIVEEYLSSDLTKKEVQLREQLWMLLYPTLNKSLLVSSNEGIAMSEETRIKLSTINKFYQYEVDKKGVILAGSEKLIFGLKELSRTGVLSLDNELFSIEYESVKGHLTSGLLWRDRFLFSYSQLQEGKQITIKNTASISKSKSAGVWVYEFQSKKFLAFEPSVKTCLTKYKISSTHFKRVRKFGLEFDGKLFSNQKLN
jgi:hypothetical protein